MPEWVKDIGALALVLVIAFGPAFVVGWLYPRLTGGRELPMWIGGVLIILGPLISVMVWLALT